MVSGLSKALFVPTLIRGRELAPANARIKTFPGEPVVEAVDVAGELGTLTLSRPEGLADLQALPMEEIVAFLAEVGDALALDRHSRIEAAIANHRQYSNMSERMLTDQFKYIVDLFSRDLLERWIRIARIDDRMNQWHELAVAPSKKPVRMRAVGCRSLHVIAGNVPSIGGLTIIRSALVRADAIIKLPRNDLFTVPAIIKTMVDVDAKHPIVKHLSAAYWQGGDPEVEGGLYNSECIEKLVLWGGDDATRRSPRIGADMDVIVFGPKMGVAIVDLDATSDDELPRLAALLALDVCELDQMACFSPRVIYTIVRKGHGSVDRCKELSRSVLDAMERRCDRSPLRPMLAQCIKAMQIGAIDQVVFGQSGMSPRVLLSLDGEKVEFVERFSRGVVNIVVLQSVEQALAKISIKNQTVAVYPAHLKAGLRDEIGLRGAQRIVDVGAAAVDVSLPGPQDGFDVLGRLCRWVVEE